MALAAEIRRAVALSLILLSLIPSSWQDESITLQLHHDQHGICFDQPVLLTCQQPDITSGVFSSTKPSWKEDDNVFALDGGMYRSVTRINETRTVLELVPKQSHFEPSGAHNYTCFLPLVGGGVIESNPLQISPIKELVNVVRVSETSVKLEWSHSRACFEDCNITFNLTWTPSQQGHSKSVETNHTMYCITSLKRDEVYEATLTALCREESQVAMVSKTVDIAFITFSDISSPNLLESAWPEIIGGSVGFAFLFVAMVITITLLCICTVMRQRKLKSESSPKHCDNKKGTATGLPLHVYDTVSSVTEGVQLQANPSYTPIVQSLQMPTATEVSMQANPSYITINDLT